MNLMTVDPLTQGNRSVQGNRTLFNSLPRRQAQFLCIPLFVILCAAAGCNRHPFACERVSGKVTYEDGSLIPVEEGGRMVVTFLPQAAVTDARHPPKQGGAMVDIKSGEFKSATTYAAGDGIVAGEHKVLVQCIVKGELRTDLVPEDYANPDTTPLVVQSNQSPFKLKLKKPG